MQQAEHWHIRL